MDFENRHEEELVQSLGDLGFLLAAIVPHGNYDIFMFYRDVKDNLYNVSILYNGNGYALAMGQDNELVYHTKTFTLPREELLNVIKAFAKKNRIKTKPIDPIVD